MSTPQTAQIYVTNATDGVATIVLWHENSQYPVDTNAWTNIGPGQAAGPLTVHFNTGIGSLSVEDYWACEIDVAGGSTPGVFESSGVLQYSKWKECQLRSADAGGTLTFSASSKAFTISLPSGGTSTPMNPVSRSSSKVYVTNTTDGHATLTLYHNNNTDGQQSATWVAGPGQKVGPLTVYFRVGLSVAIQPDYWGCKLAVQDGSAPGVYTSVGDWQALTNWNECQLEAPDVGKDLAFTVSATEFNIALPSGGLQAQMQQTGPYTLVDNVFVLMLENHSFDNIFAFSKIKGLTVASSANKNSYNGVTYAVGSSAPSAMPTDPGHEFADVVEQLCGEGATHTPWQPYNQPLSNSGFVANYATTRTEITSNNPNLPTPAQYGEIMQCFDTQKDLPVIYQLATTFAVCDHWFSSIPGPTWPNRFFVHGASSGGWADTPGITDIGGWETPGFGFTYPSGSSLFDKVVAAGMQWAVYYDPTGPLGGNVPQASALSGIVWQKNTTSFGSFAADVQGPYPYAYTFIEPNYGDVIGGSYVGGSSQHPNDSTERGEALIKATYEAIRNSPLWERSLLIITYDEHGGFYDSVLPGPAVPPGDNSPQNADYNSGGFMFDWYGVRVPAVIVSPRIAQGTVDSTPYDHASVAATLEALWGFTPMTQRDAQANNVLHLLSPTTLRTNCPTSLHNPVAGTVTPAAAELDAAARAAQPLPAAGNVHAVMAILAKTDAELANGDPAQLAAIRQRVAAISTVGEAEAYAQEVTAKAHEAQGPRPPPPPPRIPEPHPAVATSTPVNAGD